MRSIWKGAISFGLVSIPVKLYSATEERDVSFHQVRRSDGSRVKYKRVAAADGEEVPYSEIAKGYELPGGETVVLTDDDFANLPLSTSRAIDVLEFVPLDQVDPIYFAKSYYLEPDRTGGKPYALLRDALERSGRVALVKIALRQREQLATLRVRDGVFVLETMIWPDEVRTPDFPFLDEEVDVRPQELTMAESLIETLAGDFEPSKYRDSYREALQSVIDAKVAGREVVAPPSEGPAPDLAGDLMAALRASVEAAKKNRGELADTSDGAAPAEPTALAEPAGPRKPAGVGDASGNGAGAATSRRRTSRSSADSNGPSSRAKKTPAEQKAAPPRRRRSA